jgi:hypothetical protein
LNVRLCRTKKHGLGEKQWVLILREKEKDERERWGREVLRLEIKRGKYEG